MIYLAIFWIACSVVYYGYGFGYLQNKYNVNELYNINVITCIVLSLLGPLALISLFVAFGKQAFKYGFRLW